MQKAKGLLLVALALMLTLGVMGLVGCGEAEEEAVAIRSVDDLTEGDKIGVQSGTTGELWAKENLEPQGVEIVPYDDVLAAFAALQAGDVVGVINDLPTSQEIAADPARNIEVVQEIETGEQYGFAFNKENTELRDAVNWGLGEIIADGTYDEIYEKWFGAPPMSIPEGAYDGDKPADDEIETLTDGKIIVGSDTAYPPFEFVEDGETVGFDVDIVKAVGEKIGLEVEFLSYKFDALITDLQAGTSFDMVASAMTITEERAQSVDFSDPYINSNQSLTVSKVD